MNLIFWKRKKKDNLKSYKNIVKDSNVTAGGNIQIGDNVTNNITVFQKKWVVIISLVIIIALMFSNILESDKKSSNISETSVDCGFPKIFKNDSLYILITRFEDYISKNDAECYGEALRRRIDAKKLPINICYRPDLTPKQRDEVRKIQIKYNADLVIWGNLKNLAKNCGEGDICFRSQPSDTIIQICGGDVESEKFDLKYEKGVEPDGIEQGELHIGEQTFDSWISAIFNAKIGEENPDLFVIDESLPIKKQAELWFQKGELYYKVFKYYLKSLYCYNKAIQIDSTNAKFYIGRARIKDEFKNDYTGAIQDYNIAIKLNPNEAEFYNDRGQYKYKLRDFNRAITDFDKAIQIDSNFELAHQNRIKARCLISDYSGSMEDFKEFESISPFSKTILKNDLKKLKALIDLTHSNLLNPNLAKSYNDIGDFYFFLDDYTGAIWNY